MALLALLPAAMLLALPFIPESPAWRALVADGVERRKLVFACGAMVAQQVNGIQFFYSYGVVFAQSIGMADPFTVSLVTNVLQVVAVVASVLLAGRVRRRANLLAPVVVGALASGGRKDHLTAGYSTAIVVCSYVVIVAFNFGHGPLAYTIASEMATGRNRNKIMSCAIGCFFTAIWLIAFTSPYLYYDAHLGPMLGFVYAGTTCITLAYVWFCVGETAGRSNHEIELFFQRGIPVRQWRSHQFGDDGDGEADLTKEPPVERAESV